MSAKRPGRLRRWWQKVTAPEPPCTNTKCQYYGANYCPCADIDAWTTH